MTMRSETASTICSCTSSMREVALDEHHAIRLAGGNLAVLLPDAAEEGVFFLLEAAFARAGFCLHALVAAARAGERSL